MNRMNQPSTWKQFLNRRITELALEHGCSREDATHGALCELSDWQASVLAALQADWVPEQAWINAVNADEGSAYWWKMRICHDYPDIFDRMARAGRRVFSGREMASRTG